MKHPVSLQSLSFLCLYLCLYLSPVYAENHKPPIRFGLQVAQQQTTIEELKEVWKEAEALGFDSLWTNDHLLASVGPADAPELEAWTLLAAMATVTSRVQIGAMVTSNTFRHPAVLAKMAATVDHLSNGRLILGIGSGWFTKEHQVYGVPFPSVKDRTKALEEALEVITKLWSANPTVSFKGQYYTLTDAPFMPKPVQKPHPPILIGGVGEKRTLPLVAKYAQMWNIPSLPPDQVAEKGKILEKACHKVGRNCNEIERSYLTPLYIKGDLSEVQVLLQRVADLRKVSVDEVRRSVLAGDPAAIKQQMQAYIKEEFILANGEKIVRKKGGAFFRYGEKVGVADVIFGEEGDSTLLGAFTLEALGLMLDPLRRELKPLPMMLAKLSSRR